jgi:hypothetical protein
MTILHTISWLASNKGKRLLVIDGFVFQSNKISAKVTYWKCEVKECGATGHTDSNDQLIRQNGEHTHLPSPERIEIRLLKKSAKDRVKSEAIPITQIYEEELAHAHLSVAALATAPSGNEASKYLFDVSSLSLHDSPRIRIEPNSSAKSSASSNLSQLRHSRNLFKNVGREEFLNCGYHCPQEAHVDFRYR